MQNIQRFRYTFIDFKRNKKLFMLYTMQVNNGSESQISTMVRWHLSKISFGRYSSFTDWSTICIPIQFQLHRWYFVSDLSIFARLGRLGVDNIVFLLCFAKGAWVWKLLTTQFFNSNFVKTCTQPEPQYIYLNWVFQNVLEYLHSFTSYIAYQILTGDTKSKG